MTEWQPYHEHLRVTLARTVAIALVAGAVLASSWGGLARWPVASALMLWPTFGGHWIELWFLSRRAIFVSLTRGEAAVKDLTARFGGAITGPAAGRCRNG